MRLPCVRRYRGGLNELIYAMEIYDKESLEFSLLKQEVGRMLPEEIQNEN
jgi:hypothetical protein